MLDQCFRILVADGKLYCGSDRQKTDKPSVVYCSANHDDQDHEDIHQLLRVTFLHHQIISDGGQKQCGDTCPGPEAGIRGAEHQIFQDLVQKRPVPVLCPAAREHEQGGDKGNDISDYDKMRYCQDRSTPKDTV